MNFILARTSQTSGRLFLYISAREKKCLFLASKHNNQGFLFFSMIKISKPLNSRGAWFEWQVKWCPCTCKLQMHPFLKHIQAQTKISSKNDEKYIFYFLLLLNCTRVHLKHLRGNRGFAKLCFEKQKWAQGEDVPAWISEINSWVTAVFTKAVIRLWSALQHSE